MNINDIIVHHHFSAGVYIKQMRLPVHYFAMTHKHKYDHFGLLGKGSVSVEVNGKGKTYDAPCVIEIKAGEAHKITALTDVDWFCIHATHETDVNKVDEVLVMKAG